MSTSAGVGPKPRLPAPPQVPWTDPAPTPVILTNAFGDTVALESVSLLRQAESLFIMVSGPKSNLSWRLLDGSTLRVDDRTPAGHHTDINGDDIYVLAGSSYPRYVQASGDISWVVAFDVRNPVRVGAFISRTAVEALPSAYLNALALPNGFTALTDADSTWAIEFSEDGPTRFVIRLSPERRLPLVVSLFAYEGDHFNGASAVRRVGNRAEWRAENAVEPRAYPWALNTRLAFGEPRLVGRVLVDPISKGIQLIP